MDIWLQLKALAYNSPALIFIALFVVVLLYSRMQRRQRVAARAAERMQTAEALGWQHEAAEAHHAEYDHWSGELHGIAWDMQVRVPAPDAQMEDRRVYTCWRTANFRLDDGFVVLMNVPADASARPGIEIKLPRIAKKLTDRASLLFLRTMLRVAFGLNGGDVIGDGPASPEAGLSNWTPTPLDKTYTVISSDEQLARAFLAPPVDTLLQNWIEQNVTGEAGGAGIPALCAWRGGLVLSFANAVNSEQELERVTALGAAISLARSHLTARALHHEAVV